MLNGIDPIIIFQFYTTAADIATDPNLVGPPIPVAIAQKQKIELPPIPIYLSEELTGLIIESEEKSIDIDTQIDTLSSGGSPNLQQKAIGSTLSVNLVGTADSIGLTLLSAMADLIVPKVTAGEYYITYLHKATAVFQGLLHSFHISQSSFDNRYLIKIEITKTNKPKSIVPVVANPVAGSIPSLAKGA